MTRGRLALAAVAAVVLFAISPAFQGYHVGITRVDTTCKTRLLIQFCKDESARIARDAAAANAKAEREQCLAVAKEAEEGLRKLTPGNYYASCLRPGPKKQELIEKWAKQESEEETARTKREGREAAEKEAEARTEAAQKQREAEHRKARLEAEGNSLKQRAKHASEEVERLDHENKYSLSGEKSTEAFNLRYDGEKKLEEARHG